MNNGKKPSIQSEKPLSVREKQQVQGSEYDPEELVLSRKIKPRLFGLEGFSRVTVGLDIGSHTIKMVQLERVAKSHRLVSFGIVKVRPESSTPQAIEKAKLSAVKELLKDINLRKSLIVTSLDDPSIVIRQIVMPKMSTKNLAQAIHFEARKHIPYEHAGVKLTYQVLEDGKGRTSNQEILLVAVPNKIIEGHLSILRKANIEPYIVDVGPLALSNIYLDFRQVEEEETLVFLHIGASTATLNIYREGYREGGSFFSRYIAFSGKNFSKEIESGLPFGSSETEATSSSSQSAFEPDETATAHSTFPDEKLSSTLDSLLLEIRRSLTFYDNNMGHRGFKKVVISGGGSKIQGITRFLEDALMLPVEAFNPFESIDVDEGVFPKDLLKRVASQMVLAVGLAMRT